MCIVNDARGFAASVRGAEYRDPQSPCATRRVISVRDQSSTSPKPVYRCRKHGDAFVVSAHLLLVGRFPVPQSEGVESEIGSYRQAGRRAEIGMTMRMCCVS